jgi:hypothetical protein
MKTRASEKLEIQEGKYKTFLVRFQVFTSVTKKNGAFWDVTPFGSCKNQRFRGT